MTETILVTGGSGYLGGRLCLGLLKAGHQVRLATRKDPAAWMEREPLTPIRVKRYDAASIAPHLDGVSLLVHLAAVNEVVAGPDPDAALTMGGPEARQLFDAASAAAVDRILNLSTAHVYGAPLVGSFSEQSPCLATHPYAIQHLIKERLLARTCQQSGGKTEGISVRLSNAFGAPADAGVDRWTLLVNDLCTQAVTSGKLCLRSNGRQHRDFIPLCDVVDGLIALINQPKGGWDSLGGLVNLASGFSVPVVRMAERVAQCAERMFGKKPDLTLGAGGGTDAGLSLDIAKMRAIGWRPSAADASTPDNGPWGQEIEDCLRLLARNAT